MSNLTNFVPPDIKTANFRVTPTAGYVATRVAPRLPWESGTAYALAPCTAHVRNQGTSDVVVRFQETTNFSPSGTRTNLGTAVAVVAGGRKSVSFTPTKPYVELKGISGSSQLWVELATAMELDIAGPMAKGDPTYAQTDWAVEPTVAVKAASQVFASNTVWTVTHDLGAVAQPTLIDSAGNDITALATISDETTTGYTATFSEAQVGTAYSTI